MYEEIVIGLFKFCYRFGNFDIVPTSVGMLILHIFHETGRCFFVWQKEEEFSIKFFRRKSSNALEIGFRDFLPISWMVCRV